MCGDAPNSTLPNWFNLPVCSKYGSYDTSFLVEASRYRPGLFRFGDAASLAQKVTQLLAQPAQCAALGAAGREKVLANYTWEIVADRVRQVYADLLMTR